MILSNWLNFDGVKYPNVPKIICCSDVYFRPVSVCFVVLWKEKENPLQLVYVKMIG